MRQRISFPKHLEGKKYKYIRLLPVIKTTYQFAEYSDENNICYVAKMWSGAKNRYFNELQNESNFYKFISSKYKVFNKYNIHIPSYYGTYVDKNKLIVLIEKVNGETLRKSNYIDRVKAFFKVITSFKLIYSSNKKEVQNKFKHINNTAFIFKMLSMMFLFLLLKIKYLKRYFRILSLVGYFLEFPNSKSPTGLILRDTNGANLIQNKTKLNLVDFQLVCNSYTSLEFANLYYRNWDKKNANKIEVMFMNEIRKYKINLKEFKIMILYSGLYDYLFGHSISQKKSLSFIENIISI